MKGFHHKKKYRRVCKICKIKFKAVRPNIHTCSAKCRKSKLIKQELYRKKFPLEEKPCFNCGKIFLGVRRSQIFCSNKCEWLKYREQNEARLKEYNERPEIKLKKRHRHYKKTYGVGLEQYNFILKKQDNKCAICGIDQKEYHKPFVIDHDHTTKKIRGLLCYSCNNILGNVRDKKEILEKAYAYLDKSLTIEVVA